MLDSTAPVEDDDVPASHAAQLKLPSLAWYLPAAHTAHSIALPAEYLPAAHDAQLADPVAPAYLPPAQSAQLDESPAPVAPEYVPLAQLMQLSGEVALCMLKYFP